MDNLPQLNFEENYIWYSLIIVFVILIILLLLRRNNVEGFENNNTSVCFTSNGDNVCHENVTDIKWKNNHGHGDVFFNNHPVHHPDHPNFNDLPVHPNDLNNDNNKDHANDIAELEKETRELIEKLTNEAKYSSSLIEAIESARFNMIGHFAEHNAEPTLSLLHKERDATEFKIRLTAKTDQYLNIAEFECYDRDGKKIKLTNPKLSSVYPRGDENKALDGNIDGLWAAGSIAHTQKNNEKGEYFEATIDRQDLQSLATVVVYNRTDGNRIAKRLSDSSIDIIANDTHYSLVKSTGSWNNIKAKYFSWTNADEFSVTKTDKL